MWAATYARAEGCCQGKTSCTTCNSLLLVSTSPSYGTQRRSPVSMTTSPVGLRALGRWPKAAAALEDSAEVTNTACSTQPRESTWSSGKLPAWFSFPSVANQTPQHMDFYLHPGIWQQLEIFPNRNTKKKPLFHSHWNIYWTSLWA